MPKHPVAAKARVTSRATSKQTSKPKKPFKPSPQILSAVSTVNAVAEDHAAWAADPPAQLRRLHAALKALRASQRGAATADVVPRRSRDDLDGLTAWLREQDVDLDAQGLRLDFSSEADAEADAGDADVTLFASREHKAGDCMLRVPGRLALKPDAARRPVLNALASAFPAVRHNASLALIVALLLEAADADSAFAAYIRALPSRPPIPYLTFDADDMLALAPSPAASVAVNTLRAQARSYCAVYSAAARLRLAQLPVPLLCYSNWEWAVSVVMTRQNELPALPAGSGPPALALVPVWDMCNHGEGSAASAFVVEKEAPRVELTALRDFEAGDRVDMFYGRRPNIQLLQFSGFVAHGNPYDELPIDIAIAPGDAQLAQFKARVLAKHGVLVDAETASCRVKVGFGLRALHAAMGVASVASVCKERLATVLKEGGQLVREPRFSSQVERDAVAAAIQACIAQYPAPEDEPGSTQRRQIASLHAVEVAFLRDALSQLDELNGLEAEPAAAILDASHEPQRHQGCCDRC